LIGESNCCLDGDECHGPPFFTASARRWCEIGTARTRRYVPPNVRRSFAYCVGRTMTWVYREERRCLRH
jgi:hypothetical protein